MADDKDLEKEKAIAAAKAKAAAAAKAKAAALAKAQAQGQSSTNEPSPVAEKEVQSQVAEPASTEEKADDLADAKAKAIAAAKAKAAAAAAAKAKALGLETPAPESAGDVDDAKAKAIAAAKAKAAAAAAAKAKALGQETPADAAGDADDAKAKAIAAAKAKAAAAAAAKAKAAGGDAEAGAPAEEEKPSKNKPLLDLIVKKIQDNIGADAIEQAYINFQGKEVPTLYIKKERLLEVANLLYHDADLDFKFLSNLHGIDFETHMEVYYFLQSYAKHHYVALHVKTDRDPAVVPSVTSIWYGANWQEREAYDLLGIAFEGHPNMTRLFLPETWVGHPLRKDYVQYDEGV